MKKKRMKNMLKLAAGKPRFQKEFIWRGQGYDCKWDFISNTKYNSSDNRSMAFKKKNLKRKKYYILSADKQ